jgi:hypothetical protein
LTDLCLDAGDDVNVDDGDDDENLMLRNAVDGVDEQDDPTSITTMMFSMLMMKMKSRVAHRVSNPQQCPNRESSQITKVVSRPNSLNPTMHHAIPKITSKLQSVYMV